MAPIDTTEAGTAKQPQPRLAYSVRETAEMIGASKITIYRLLNLGKLKAIPGLRTKLIPMAQIQKLLS